MSRPRPPRDIQPRMLTLIEVAHRLGHGEGWFTSNRQKLEAEGFPKMDPLLERWDSDAVDDWLDRRSGRRGVVVQPTERRRSVEAELIRRAQDGSGHA